MPPKQCPSCGRFLKNDFVDALQDASAECPRCGETLVADMFGSTGTSAGSDQATTGGLETERVSVRPPDLEPASVRDTARDVLAGWDVTADADEIASWQRDRRPFPTDTVVVVGSGVFGAVAGGVIGSSLAPRRVGVGAAGGLTLGLALAAVTRRVWRLR